MKEGMLSILLPREFGEEEKAKILIRGIEIYLTKIALSNECSSLEEAFVEGYLLGYEKKSEEVFKVIDGQAQEFYLKNQNRMSKEFIGYLAQTHYHTFTFKKELNNKPLTFALGYFFGQKIANNLDAFDFEPREYIN